MSSFSAQLAALLYLAGSKELCPNLGPCTRSPSDSLGHQSVTITGNRNSAGSIQMTRASLLAESSARERQPKPLWFSNRGRPG